jgi:non-specific serine/threonine protein kinase
MRNSGPMSLGDFRAIYASGDCEIDLARRELRIGGSAVPVGARAFEIVELLAQSAGELVTKEELIGRIWPGAVVSDNTLQVHAAAVRKALGPHRGLLKTEAGRGYRLLGNWSIRRQDDAMSPVGLNSEQISGESPGSNFPLTATRLVGREVAVQRVRDLVSAYRFVTLTGPGGIGKTTLALEIGRHILGEFAGGGWFVELASLSNPNLVPSTVAGVLGLKIGGEISADSVARAVGETNLLLVLDNCEHVVDTVAGFVETLLNLCPRTTILTTSRELLGINGEYVYRVPPLEVPDADEDEPDYILGRTAVELFIARARALDSEFLPRVETLPAIGAICRHLDGIPLAIEFAAARAAMLGVGQVTADLRDRFALLTRGRRTALPRHQTLRAVLDWSHELLTDAERRLLRRLAVFPAGFTLDAVAAVMNDPGPAVSTIMDGIANLVSKSLVMLDKSEKGARWYLLETTRAYALDKLGDSGEAPETARRQAEFYLALFAPFGTQGELQTAIDGLGHYRIEIDNLRAALNWAFSSSGDTTLGVALAVAAADFWASASLIPEACEWAGKALAQIGDAVGTRREMVLQCSFGITLLLTKGMNDDVREALARALTLARKFSDFDYQQRATHNFWLFLLRASALHDALAIARQFEEVDGFGDAQSRAVVDCWVGMTLIYLAEHLEAIERVQRAIDHYPIESRGRDMIRFAGDLPAIVASQIAVSLLSRGLLDTASRSAVRAVEEARRTNHPAVVCIGLAWAAAYIFLSLGDLEVAESYGNELVGYASMHGLHPFYATGLCVRGSLAAKRADPNAGVELLRRGITEMRQAGYQQFYPFFLVELAAALGALGRIDDGLDEIDAGLRFAAETGHQWFVPETLRIKGHLCSLRGKSDIAVEDCFNRGIEVAREQNALFWELRLTLGLARLRATQGHHGEARQILAPVYDRFTEGFDTVTLMEARKMLDALQS